MADAITPVLRDIDPMRPSKEHSWQAARLLPRMILSVDKSDGFAWLGGGWGPGYEILTRSDGIKRLPYLYPTRSEITSAFEKFVYHVLSDVYTYLDTVGRSLLAAWGDFHPVLGWRFGDADELEESRGVPMLDPDTVRKPRIVVLGTP